MMNNHYALTRRALVATGVAIGLGLSQGALAATADGDLEITAGLANSLTVTCATGLDFGTTTLGVLARDAATTITVDESDGTLTVGGNSDGVAHGVGSAGSCTFSGSTVTDGGPYEVNFPTANVYLTGDGVDTPLVDELEVKSLVSDKGVVTNGQATFTIGGELSIPATVTADNLGNYSTTIEVTVDDDFGAVTL